jgi:Fe-S-cluster containining protein
MSNDRGLDPPMIDAIERLALELADHVKFADEASRFAWLVEVLIDRGHLEERHRAIAAKLRAPHELRVFLAQPDRETPDPEIDCASLLPLCHARCCSFNVALTEDEVRAGRVRWDIEMPYVLERDLETGYCTHLDERGACKCYQVRPNTCRTYDCRRDPRVWIDFETRRPAPLHAGLVPLGTKRPR